MKRLAILALSLTLSTGTVFGAVLCKHPEYDFDIYKSKYVISIAEQFGFDSATYAILTRLGIVTDEEAREKCEGVVRAFMEEVQSDNPTVDGYRTRREIYVADKNN